jgi:predicted SAM-dependent methyltransferase
MFHVLEHLSWKEGPDVNRHVREWLRKGGQLVVEVPDMERIMERGTYPTDWVSWVYGVQDHEGEYHRAGYTLESLYQLVAGCGLTVTRSNKFLSEHPARPGFPCVSVTAIR